MDGDNIYTPTEQFSRKLEKVKHSDPSGYKRIRQVMDRLLEVPEDADGKMHGLYNGRFKKYVGRKDYRIIYHWCQLCRKENRRLEKRCDDCHKIPDNSVVFLDLYHKNEMKKVREG
jgi:mRNA-degrading endonuclease YafQ of YafQ-DinJ toxin-antitoxin module